MQWPKQSEDAKPLRPETHRMLDEGCRIIAYAQATADGLGSAESGLEGSIRASEILMNSVEVVREIAKGILAKHGGVLTTLEQMTAFSKDLSIAFHRKCLEILEESL